jgi:hypothetical protein
MIFVVGGGGREKEGKECLWISGAETCCKMSTECIHILIKYVILCIHSGTKFSLVRSIHLNNVSCRCIIQTQWWAK